jgi:hypothetical protein
MCDKFHIQWCLYTMMDLWNIINDDDDDVFNVWHFKLMFYYIELHLLDHYTKCFDSLFFFIHSFIHIPYIIQTWNLSFNISINNLSSSVSRNKHQLCTNTISDREIHVSIEHNFKTFPYISNTYKGRVEGTAQINTNKAPN